jgi:hypothetical protein
MVSSLLLTFRFCTSNKNHRMLLMCSPRSFWSLLVLNTKKQHRHWLSTVIAMLCNLSHITPILVTKVKLHAMGDGCLKINNLSCTVPISDALWTYVTIFWRLDHLSQSMWFTLHRTSSALPLDTSTLRKQLDFTHWSNPVIRDYKDYYVFIPSLHCTQANCQSATVVVKVGGKRCQQRRTPQDGPVQENWTNGQDGPVRQDFAGRRSGTEFCGRERLRE